MVLYAVAVSVVVAAPNPNTVSRAAAAADHDWNIRYKKKPSDEEMAKVRRWAVKKFADQEPELPFSFVYDGRASGEFLKTWNRKTSAKKTDGPCVRRTVAYTDHKTGLKIEWKITEYADFPAIEWVLLFENTGPRDTPILSDVNPADVKFTHSGAGEFVLHYSDGRESRATDLQPSKVILSPKATQTATPEYGRSPNVVLR